MSDTSIEQAADALLGAKRVLVSTGAGMSADSGIPTYRDKEGRWRDFQPFTRLGLRPADFSNPPGYRERPQYAWAFAEYMRRQMGKAPLHKGYPVITRWLLDVIPDAFLLTTNVDDLHRRAGVPDSLMWERYGNIWELQCLSRCTGHWWPEKRVELCDLDLETMEAHNFPRCPFCGDLARPRMQMEHDPDFIEREPAWQFYQNFLGRGDVDVYVVIGTTLWFSWPEEMQHKPQVISINPDPSTHEHYDEPIAITMGAADALDAIDEVMLTRT
ncbi:MAG: hypothetical protein H6727_04835 [Myxococcales bacterium]|nr:hypothetical protein [Myxococcales bacterium]